MCPPTVFFFCFGAATAGFRLLGTREVVSRLCCVAVGRCRVAARSGTVRMATSTRRILCADVASLAITWAHAGSWQQPLSTRTSLFIGPSYPPDSGIRDIPVPPLCEQPFVGGRRFTDGPVSRSRQAVLYRFQAKITDTVDQEWIFHWPPPAATAGGTGMGTTPVPHPRSLDSCETYLAAHKTNSSSPESPKAPPLAPVALLLVQGRGLNHGKIIPNKSTPGNSNHTNENLVCSAQTRTAGPAGHTHEAWTTAGAYACLRLRPAAPRRTSTVAQWARAIILLIALFFRQKFSL